MAVLKDLNYLLIKKSAHILIGKVIMVVAKKPTAERDLFPHLVQEVGQGVIGKVGVKRTLNTCRATVGHDVIHLITDPL